ncbi:MAG: hypothetical protein QXQ64_08790 [Candidatus Bathyarchaeia archaeon]
MEKWQITAILGTIIFLIAGFLPLASFLGIVAGGSLIDLYSAALGGGAAPASALLVMILYPITVILGFVSIIKHKLAIIAGILGIICWIGAILFINEISGGVLGYGYGIYVGFIGAIILLVTYFIKPKAAT